MINPVDYREIEATAEYRLLDVKVLEDLKRAIEQHAKGPETR